MHTRIRTQQTQKYAEVEHIIANRYRILKKLGEGGMGAVYKVRDTVEHKILALKTICRRKVKQEALLRFKREFLRMTKIHHPHIVRVYDFGESSTGDYYFTMDYLEGKNISEFFAKRLDYKMFYKVIAQVCQALSYIHGQNMIHMDIKSSNIMITKKAGKAQTKILDFGLAIDVEDKMGEIKFGGTLGYTSPEVLTGIPLDFRTDFYSLGAVLYEVLTGTVPFHADSISDLVRNQIHGNPRRLVEINPQVPIQLEAMVLKLLERKPADRFQSIDEVLEMLSRISGQTYRVMEQKAITNFVLSGKFVNRKRELSNVSAKLVETQKGNGYGLLFQGEVGVGKTRLLDEIKIFCQIEGINYFAARCHGRSSTPYRPIIDILEQLILSLEHHDQKLLRHYGAVLVKLIPALSKKDYLKRLRAPVALGPDAEKLRLFDRLTELFIKSSERLPHSLVIAIDDIQAADDSSLEFLRFLARNMKSSRILLLANYSMESITPQLKKPLVLLFEEFKELTHWHIVNVSSLSLNEISEFVSSLLGMKENLEEISTWIYEKTGGSPFFAEELVKTLVRGNCLVRKRGQWVFEKDMLSKIRLPKTVTGTVKQKVVLFDPKTQQLLGIAAVIGREFNFRLLRTISRESEDKIVEVLDHLVAEGILMREKGVTWKYRFAHHAIRDTIYDRLKEQAKIGYHRKLAEVLEEQYKGNTDEIVGELAMHYLKGKVHAKAYPYLLKAADKAETTYAHGQTMFFLTKALSLVQRFGKPSDQLALVERLGNVQQISGRYNAALRSYEKAISLAQAAPTSSEKIAGLYDKIGRVYSKQARYERSLESLQCGLEYLKHNHRSVHYARLMNATVLVYYWTGKTKKALAAIHRVLKITKSSGLLLGRAESYRNLGLIYSEKGEYGKAIFNHRKALVLRRRARDLSAVGSSYNDLGICYARQLDIDMAISLYRKALDVARRMGDLHQTAAYLNNLALSHHEKHQYSVAEEYMKMSLEISLKIGSKFGVALAYDNLGVFSRGRTDWSTTLDYHTKSLKLRKMIGDSLGQMTVYCNLGALKQAMSQLKEALFYHREALKLAESAENWREAAYNCSGIGGVLSELGDFKQAVTYLDRAIDLCLHSGYTQNLGSIYHQYAELYVHMANITKAWDYINKVLAISKKSDVKTLEGSACRTLGVIFRLRGRSEQAVASVQKSIAIEQDLMILEELARSYLELSLLELGKEKFDEATNLLTKAAGIYSKLAEHIDDPPESVADINRALGMVLWKQKKYSLAGEYYRNALNIIKGIWQKHVPKEFKESYLLHPKRQQLRAEALRLQEEAAKKEKL